MICVSLANMEYRQCLKAVRKNRFTELRLDLLSLKRDEISTLFSSQAKLIATCRKGIYNEKERLSMLTTAIKSGAAYVDIEIDSEENFKKEIIRISKDFNCKIIVSYHNFTETPSDKDLINITNDCTSIGGDIVKIACLVNDNKDLARLMALYAMDLNILVIGMGKLGIVSRIMAPLLGAEFTYATYAKGSETAPGQLTRKKMLKIYQQIGYTGLINNH